MPDQTQYPLKYAAHFPEVAHQLSKLPRTGWVQWDITNPETVWEHICSTRELAIHYKDQLQLRPDELNELLAMIEIHDWPEAIVGDGVILGDEPNVHALRQHKKARELVAIQTICHNQPDGEHIIALYNRYAHGSDHIAKITKQLEKLQAVIKAAEYERTQAKSGLTAEFIHYTKDLIIEPVLAEELNRIHTEKCRPTKPKV